MTLCISDCRVECRLKNVKGDRDAAAAPEEHQRAGRNRFQAAK
jgi:hypothetical protein